MRDQHKQVNKESGSLVSPMMKIIIKQGSQPQHSWHFGLLILGCEGGRLVSCIVGCLEYPWPLLTKCQELCPHTSCDNQKCHHTLPNIPWGARSPLVGNHWYRDLIYSTEFIKRPLIPSDGTIMWDPRLAHCSNWLEKEWLVEKLSECAKLQLKFANNYLELSS